MAESQAAADFEKSKAKSVKRITKEISKFKGHQLVGSEKNTRQKVVDEANKKGVSVFVKFRSKTNTIYTGRDFVLHMFLPYGYPFKGPQEVKFMHQVYHPAVDIETNDICPHALGLEEWKPTIKMNDIIERVNTMLGEEYFKQLSSGSSAQAAVVNTDAAQLFSENEKKFNDTAKAMMKKKKPPSLDACMKQ